MSKHRSIKHLPRDVVRIIRAAIRGRSEVRHLPRDLLRVLRGKSARRRVQDGIFTVASSPQDSATVQPAADARQLDALLRYRMIEGPTADAINEMEAFQSAPEFEEMIATAARVDGNIANLAGRRQSLVPAWHDGEYPAFLSLVNRIPAGQYDSVILMPFCKLGGSDFVAGVLAGALARDEQVLILRTEASDWERPDWFPDSAVTVDISDLVSLVEQKTRLLYCLMSHIRPGRIFNVNSNLGFRTLEEYGGQLSAYADLFAYYFCADRTEDGFEVGYPVWFFTAILPHLQAALVDTSSLTETLVQRHSLPAPMAERLQTIYTPAMGAIRDRPLAAEQIETCADRTRPLLLWAGRFDRQKRFDLLVEIARRMPDTDFACWGKAVLDAPPKLSNLPPNMTLNGTYGHLDELPLTEADGWLYTAEWDGLPTILIECGALGMPIVASAVGGVPELIDNTTGWPVDAKGPANGSATEDADAYIATIHEMLADPDQRLQRAQALQERVRTRHSVDAYRQSLERAGARRKLAKRRNLDPNPDASAKVDVPAAESNNESSTEPTAIPAAPAVAGQADIPDISVVMTCHNEGLLVGATIASAKAAIAKARESGLQSEVIVVMDRCTALTADACRSGFGDMARYLETDEGDPGQARNRGIEQARGRFSSFLDADDLWSTNWLTEASALVRDAPECVAHSACNYVFGGGPFEPHLLWWHIDSGTDLFEPEYLVWGNYWDALSLCQTETYRNFPFRRNDLKRGFGHEDWHWNVMTLAAGIAHRPAPRTLHFKRRRSGSQMGRVARSGAIVWPNGWQPKPGEL